MKKLYLLLLIPFTLHAQSDKERKFTDSASYYRFELEKMWRAHMDSLYNSEAYKELRENYANQVKKSRDYSGFVIFMDIVGSDYRHFNKLLAEDGFPPLHNISYRFGFGTSSKVDRLMIDLYFLALGIRNSTSRGDEEIAASFNGILQFDLGYDLLKSKIFSLYPYGGIALRSSSLIYEKPGQLNPDYSSLVNMISEEKRISVESFRVGYQLGAGLDCALFPKENSYGKIILFVKAGINKPFWKDAYRVHADLPTYKPEISHGDYMISFGFKFVGKR